MSTSNSWIVRFETFEGYIRTKIKEIYKTKIASNIKPEIGEK